MHGDSLSAPLERPAKLSSSQASPRADVNTDLESNDPSQRASPADQRDEDYYYDSIGAWSFTSDSGPNEECADEHRKPMTNDPEPSRLSKQLSTTDYAETSIPASEKDSLLKKKKKNNVITEVILTDLPNLDRGDGQKTLATSSDLGVRPLYMHQVSVDKSGAHTFLVTNYGVTDVPVDSTLPRKRTYPILSDTIKITIPEDDVIPEIPTVIKPPALSLNFFSIPKIKIETGQKSLRYTLNNYRGTVARLVARGRKFANRKTNRLVLKNGKINIANTHVSRRGWRYILDIFTTILDLHWCYLLAIFVVSFVLSWILFAIIWWAISYYHNDHLHVGSTDWEPCAIGVYDFYTALLFSIETQHTIGYGTRSITRSCVMGVIILMLQSIVGVLITAMFTGLVFAKFARPKQRGETILFSKTAVICENNGVRCLIIRVADMRKSYMVSVSIRGVLIHKEITNDDDVSPVTPVRHENLHIMSEAEDFFFLAWPIKLVHVIDENSPLWTVTADELLIKDFEIVIVLEGINPTTGQTTQVCTSYLPAEINWGHRFTPLFTEKKAFGHWTIDYTRFHETRLIDMSEESAYERARRILIEQNVKAPGCDQSEVKQSETSPKQNYSDATKNEKVPDTVVQNGLFLDQGDFILSA